MVTFSSSAFLFLGDALAASPATTFANFCGNVGKRFLALNIAFLSASLVYPLLLLGYSIFLFLFSFAIDCCLSAYIFLLRSLILLLFCDVILVALSSFSASNPAVCLLAILF